MKEEFELIYTKLYNENQLELEELRLKSKNETKKVIFWIVAVFLGFMLLFVSGIALFALPFIFLGAFFVIINLSKSALSKDSPTLMYKKVFKEKIIVPLINNIFQGATYSPNKGWTISQYKEAGYRDVIDRYSSEDLIIAPIKLREGESSVIEFCEVHTEKEHEDKDGHTSYTTVFHGIASKMKISKNIVKEIYIKRNWATFGNRKVKMDSSEFEKKFDVETTDKILAVRVLTSDVMAEMLDMREKYGYQFEMHIICDTIYMRVFTGEVFEPNIFKNSMEHKTLEKYYKVIDAMMSLSKHIYSVIDDIEI